MKRQAGFTLVEIMIVVAILGLLSAIAIPSFQKARTKSHVNACMDNMAQIEGAKVRWALDNAKGDGTAVTWDDIDPYMKRRPQCPAGGEYDELGIGASVYCTIHDWRPQYQGQELEFEGLSGFNP